ncbi:MAG: type II toxin-antitoxin system VapC family toxin [Chloroflexi bacterium]|nr:type II toxin-antitoxin system VapC family toxin [Chloroflexota bacterium]
MNAVIVDTDILIDFLRGQPGAKKFFGQLIAQSVVCCSAITVAELHAGMREWEEQATRDLTGGLVVLPVTQEIAEKAGRLKRYARGFAPGLGDCLVAATAILEDVPLATTNRKHYPFEGLELDVPDYEGRGNRE